MGIYAKELHPEVEQQYQRFFKIMQGIEQLLVKKFKKKPLFVLFPTRLQVYDYEWQWLDDFFSINLEKMDPDLPSSKLLQLCEKEGLNCLGTLSELRKDFNQNNEPLYLPLGDMHFTARGQSVIAQLIFDKMKAP